LVNLLGESGAQEAPYAALSISVGESPWLIFIAAPSDVETEPYKQSLVRE